MNLVWKTGVRHPERNDQMRSEHFLCIPLESDIPIVLVYQYEVGEFTQGGGDTQRVRWWAKIPTPYDG